MTTDRIWLITGASSGVGSALAEAAVAAGDRVIGAARRPDSLAELATDPPDAVESVQLDVIDPDAIAAVVTQVEERYGRIDVLVNNAGHGQVGAVGRGRRDRAARRGRARRGPRLGEDRPRHGLRGDRQVTRQHP